MTTREINESPERTTAGLSSAIQMVDYTAAEMFAIENNTSSSVPIVGILIQRTQQFGRESEQEHRKADFHTALRESLQKNKSIIQELARY